MLGGRSENPDLWAFLESLHPGEVLSGTIAAIERFGVFVALDDGPVHPIFAGVGFITLPDLSWKRFEAALDVVQIGQQVSCRFIQFDTWNLEARLSLRAMQPDPFQTFADHAALGQTIVGRVTRLVPFGAFVQVADAVEGLVHAREIARMSQHARGDVMREGDELVVSITAIDREQRRLELDLR